MRLIDAEQFDCIAWGEDEEKEYGDTFKGGVEFILDKIQNAPTVVHEKQVPKKPIDNFFDKRCPSCNSIWGITKNEKFCPNCGQAIEWDESR